MGFSFLNTQTQTHRSGFLFATCMLLLHVMYHHAWSFHCICNTHLWVLSAMLYHFLQVYVNGLSERLGWWHTYVWLRIHSISERGRPSLCNRSLHRRMIFAWTKGAFPFSQSLNFWASSYVSFLSLVSHIHRRPHTHQLQCRITNVCSIFKEATFTIVSSIASGSPPFPKQISSTHFLSPTIMTPSCF